MDKKDNIRRKIVIYASVGLVGVVLSASSGISINEKNVEHLNEYYSLSYISEEKHDLLKGNNYYFEELKPKILTISEHHKGEESEYLVDEVYYKIDNGIYTETINSSFNDSESCWFVPNGYVLVGNVAVKVDDYDVLVYEYPDGSTTTIDITQEEIKPNLVKTLSKENQSK